MVLITTPVFTRLLTKDEFGYYSNYVSWLNIFQVIATLNVQATLVSAKYDYKRNFNEYVLSVFSLSALSILLWTIFINIFSKEMCSFLSLDIKYINLMFIYLLMLMSITIFQKKEQFFYRYKTTVIISMIITLFTAFLSIVLVMLFKNKIWGRILGSVIPTIIIGLILCIELIYKGKRVNIKCWNYALPICLPYIPHLLSMTLLNSMDRTMITKICGVEFTALYSVATTCGSAVSVINASLNDAFSPWLADKLNSKEFVKIKKVSYFYVGIFTYGAFGIMLFSPELLWLLGGKEYMEAQYVMPPIAMGAICQFLYTMFVNIEQARKKTLGMAIASAIAALINFILNSIYIPKFGYIAAAYTTLIGFMCLLFMHMFLVKIIGFSSVYNYKFFLFIILGMCFLTIGVNYLFVALKLRYLIIAIYLISILVFLPKPINIINTFIKHDKIN